MCAMEAENLAYFQTLLPFQLILKFSVIYVNNRVIDVCVNACSLIVVFGLLYVVVFPVVGGLLKTWKFLLYVIHI
jgi:hypothetical protein